MKKLLNLLPLLLLALPVRAQALAAFPGAMGGGAMSVGGRGGVVMEVTNRNSLGTGSLCACVGASGARHCIFRIAGIFPQACQANSPFLSIDCQTAPGEVIIGGPVVSGGLRISTHDVVIRYCTFSPDSTTIPSGPDGGTVGITIANCLGVSPSVPANAHAGCYNIITDHVTTRWSGNKSWITTSNFTPGMGTNGNGDGPNHDITVQWHLDYEPDEGHPVAYGTATDETCVGTRANNNCLSPFEVNVDFHHSMFVNVHHRIPENSNGSTRWTDNIGFNWGWYANEWLGAELIDDISNKFIQGNLNALGAQTYPIHFTTNSPEMSGAPSVYVAGNIFGGHGANTVAADQYGSLVNQITGENGNETGPIPASWERSGPMPASNAYPIVVDPATNLDTVILGTVGNSQHLDCLGNWVLHRDAADQRIITQYQNGTAGGYWPNGVTYTGGNPNGGADPAPTADYQDNPLTNFPVCTESLHDGIPDAWKQANGLSLTDATLYAKPAANGYTNLENYINGVASVTPPPVNPPSANGATITPASGGSLTDGKGNGWAFGAVVPISSDNDCAPVSCGNVVVQNGTPLTGTAATLLLYYNSTIYQENASSQWWLWNGSTWTKAPGDPRPVTPPPTPPVVTCVPNSVQTGGTSTCTANQAVAWTTSAGSITSAGVLTAPATAGSVSVTGTNANGSSTATVTVTAVTPPTCPTLPVKVAVTVGGVAVGSMTCTPNQTGTGYVCSIP